MQSTTTEVLRFICSSEDAWTWIALLCGNHYGALSAFIGL